MKFLIVGAGFSGAVVAEQLSKFPENEILVVDERSHIGGNCFTERDKDTGIMIHKYGPHLFHTSNQHVWDYICQFTEMMPFINRVKTIYKGQVYSLPVNLHTLNQFFGKAMNPKEAELFLHSLTDKSIIEPHNFEEQALKMIGRELYDAFFYGYTKKQWGCDPKELPAEVLKRLPVRFNYNDNYYNDCFQGIPKEGYTPVFEKMLAADNIEVKLNTRFDQSWNLEEFDRIFYTGSMDTFFESKFGRLSYRTVSFEKHVDSGDFQGNAVINYADVEVPFTRIHEHKHFTPWENHEKTVYFKEYSKETEKNDIPFYPKRFKEDLSLLEKYLKEAEKYPNVTFLGRLGTYRYLDMDKVIEEALEVARNSIEKWK